MLLQAQDLCVLVRQIVCGLPCTIAKLEAETYADYQQMGRFTLRDKVRDPYVSSADILLMSGQGNTIAIGKITKLITE